MASTFDVERDEAKKETDFHSCVYCSVTRSVHFSIPSRRFPSNLCDFLYSLSRSDKRQHLHFTAIILRFDFILDIERRLNFLTIFSQLKGPFNVFLIGKTIGKIFVHEYEYNFVLKISTDRKRSCKIIKGSKSSRIVVPSSIK